MNTNKQSNAAEEWPHGRRVKELSILLTFLYKRWMAFVFNTKIFSQTFFIQSDLQFLTHPSSPLPH